MRKPKYSRIDPATGRNKRETGQLAKRQQRAASGGSYTVSAPRRRNGRIAESRAAWRRRQRTGRG
jgi:hypothetical protein